MGMYTVVLIPGLVSDHLVWADLARALAPQGPVVTADLTYGEDIPAWAARLLAENDGPLLAIGHSMGGRVALEMARQAPARMVGLVLANTGHGPKKDGEEIRRQQMIDLGHADIEQLIAQWLPGMLAADRVKDATIVGPLSDMVRRAGADVHERQIRALIARPDATAYLGEITCPILALAAENDLWSPVAQHAEIAAAAPHASLVVIEKAGHFAPVERPAAVTQAITRWIAERCPMTEMHAIPDTPLFDRAGSQRGYKINKMAMALGKPENRARFKENEEAYLDSFGLAPHEKAAIMARDWHEMVRLGGNLFFILKISAIDPTPITKIGAAQASMDHDDFLRQRLGKKI